MRLSKKEKEFVFDLLYKEWQKLDEEEKVAEEMHMESSLEHIHTRKQVITELAPKFNK